MRHELTNAWNRCACCPEPRQPVGLDPVQPLSALETADELCAALARMGISADVHEGRGLALVSVWTGLVVWTDGL
ncbi:hypothetical protein ABT120_25685 [Nonomuraea angiospora]|uniref:hypothetical protein n=1 Tax=Nonomuraea angiospora TaxID=46172 RepID=UPI0033314C18